MIELMRTRRSIRVYEKRPIDKASMDVLKEALLRSPSSRATNPWTFIFVDDPDMLVKLSKAKEHGSDFVKGAALAVVVCGDASVSDVWVEDCAIASIVLQLAAHSLGLGSCWSQIRRRAHTAEVPAEAYLQGVLGIPKNRSVLDIIAIGYPAEAKSGKPAGELDYGKIHYNRYGAKKA